MLHGRRGVRVIIGDTKIYGNSSSGTAELRIIAGNAYFDSKTEDIGKIESIGGEITGSERLKKQYEKRQKKLAQKKLLKERLSEKKQEMNKIEFMPNDIAIITEEQHITAGEVNQNNALVRLINRLKDTKER